MSDENRMTTDHIQPGDYCDRTQAKRVTDDNGGVIWTRVIVERCRIVGPATDEKTRSALVVYRNAAGELAVCSQAHFLITFVRVVETEAVKP